MALGEVGGHQLAGFGAPLAPRSFHHLRPLFSRGLCSPSEDPEEGTIGCQQSCCLLEQRTWRRCSFRICSGGRPGARQLSELKLRHAWHRICVFSVSHPPQTRSPGCKDRGFDFERWRLEIQMSHEFAQQNQSQARMNDYKTRTLCKQKIPMSGDQLCPSGISESMGKNH